jgi:hypothetical protein
MRRLHDVVISNNIVTGHCTDQYVGIFIGGDGTSAALMGPGGTVTRLLGSKARP